MTDITLTGGKLYDPSSKPGEGIEMLGGGGGGPGGGGGGYHPSIDDLADASPDEIVKAVSTLMRFGRFEALQPLLDQLEKKKITASILQQLDDGGHSLFHWAAKRVDDIRFLQTLIDLAIKFRLTPAVLNIASEDNVGMRPLHWACTEGSIPHTALLLKHGGPEMLEARDTSGCTPLLIAAQYGQVEVCAFLIKKGANIKAVDTSLDSALHWAAYKGSSHVCGFLAYYPDALSFATQDAYGQTPLHLGSLRGHTSVVRYILQRLSKKEKEQVLFQKDKNERTPLDLAVHKNRPNVEAVLREEMATVEDPRGHFFRKTLWSNLTEFCSPKSWKKWMGFTAGMDEMDELSKFPYYFILVNFVLHLFFMTFVFAPVGSAGQGLLWDKSGLLLFNFTFMILTWYFFWMTVKTKPGYVDDSLREIQKWRKLYEETLESYADESADPASYPFQLCHTCHVARPLRSKHCRFQRKCVLVFDHFCPFVDNTIGLHNYKYFYLFLASMVFAILSFAGTLALYVIRYRASHGGAIPWVILLLGLEICFIIFPVGGLCIYHTQLSMVNLTTNEHINVRRYKYLYPVVRGKRQYKNPWFKGFFGNFMDRMSPSSNVYEVPEDHVSLMAKTPAHTGGGAHCAHCESV
mmetsp:Transcript_55064/g.133785  ORF Transcript_55064/g.133785 Transcript_55064/m.133785 type:complete len:634 (+) Transcript_55064:324-2225(+)